MALIPSFRDLPLCTKWPPIARYSGVFVGALALGACSGTESSGGSSAGAGGASPAAGSNSGGSSAPNVTGGASSVAGAPGLGGTSSASEPAGGTLGSGGTTAVGSSWVGGAATTGGANTGGANTGGANLGGANLGGATTGATTAKGGSTSTTGGTSAKGGSSSTTGGTGAGGTSGASTGGQTSTTLPPKVCDEPTPWALPTTSRVVGTGTAASCTASALATAVTAGGYVTFNCGTAPVTIALTTAIQVTKTTVVDGAGLITLDGGGTVQLMVVASNNSLSVRNLRFINGKAPDNTEAAGIGGAVSGNWRSKVEVIGCTFEDNAAARGGGAVAVWTGSSLTIVSSRFNRNKSWYGGAVYSLLSPLQVVNSEFTNNSTLLQTGYGDGGAIGTDGASESPSDTIGGTIQICGTQIRGNQGNGSGGGAYLWMYPPDEAIIDRSTIASNSVVKNASNQGAIGGAMRVSNGKITLKDSSFLSNTSIGNGGGLYLDCAPTCTITNSTFYANKNTAGWGGAIFSGTTTGQFDINNTTFANNAQQGTSGNAFFGTAVWNIKNSVFLDNNCASTGTGSNVLQWSTASKSAGSGLCIASVIAKDPALSVPADNGGPTFTMLPGAASGAFAAGSGCESTDQRGLSRSTTTCDVGSVEVP